MPTVSKVSLTGTVTRPDHRAVPDVYVLAVNRSDLCAQYPSVTGPDGRFALSVPAGIYDLILNVLGQEPFTFIRVGIIVSEVTVLDTELPLEHVPGLSGRVQAISGENAEWEIRVQSISRDDTTKRLSESQFSLDQDGRFRLGELPAGYYSLKLVHSSSARFQDVLVCYADRPVALIFDSGNSIPRSSHAADLKGLQCPCSAPPQEEKLGRDFKQSSPFSKVDLKTVHFTDGVMYVTPPMPIPSYMIAYVEGQNARNLCIYVTTITSPIFNYGLVVETTFAWSPQCHSLPPGVWHFTDASGDTYTLYAIFAYRHIVEYNSNNPSIVAASFDPSNIGQTADRLER